MAEENTRKYNFSWDLIGDIDDGRPNLGHYARLEIYRLMQFTFRDTLEGRFGSQVADEIFYQAGELAGKAFYQNYLSEIKEFDNFVLALQEVMKEMRIGILRVEQADLAHGQFTLTVSEDLDCSGLPELDFEVCVYDEGFIAALMESFTGRKFKVKEVDCWCTGDRTCRFRAEVVA